jgi:hypothetical protein
MVGWAKATVVVMSCLVEIVINCFMNLGFLDTSGVLSDRQSPFGPHISYAHTGGSALSGSSNLYLSS